MLSIILHGIIVFCQHITSTHGHHWTPLLNPEGVKNMSKFVKIAVGALALLSIAAVGGMIREIMRDDGPPS